MDVWFIILLSFILCAALKSFLHLSSHGKTKQTKLSLPPGPLKVPIIGNLIWLYKSFSEIVPIIQKLNHRYGPIITLYVGSRPIIFISSHSLAHQALVENSAIFADRPPSTVLTRIITSNHHDINSAHYGPLWTLLRRNLTSELLHPSRAKSYSHARNWALQTLKMQLRYHVESGESVRVMDHIQYTVFSLLLFMCFGEKVDEKVIREADEVLRIIRSNYLMYWVAGQSGQKDSLDNAGTNCLKTRQREESVLIPLIRARRQQKEKKQENPDEFFVPYVDSMFNLELPHEGGRKLTEEEMVTLCSEILNAGTETTSAALEWIMANLVKHQEIQEKLYQEIEGVVGIDKEIEEGDLSKMEYLKAVVLEGLRRHSPAPFSMPRAVTEDVVLDGHVIPKEAIVFFVLAPMACDQKIWKNPMEFKPERFLSDEGEGFDITGSREIKMIPFGAGRRICPGLRLSTLHLEYFVANLIRDFKWTAVAGVDVDFTEKIELASMMKNPLQAHISPRVKK